MVLGLYYIRVVLGYLLISAVLSIIGRPLMSFLEGRRVRGRRLPGSVCSVLTLFSIYLIFAGLFALFAPLIIEEAHVLSSIDTEKVKEAWAEPVADLETWLDTNGFVPDGEDKSDFVGRKMNELLKYISVSDMIYVVLAQLGNLIVLLFSVTFITFFLLKERSTLYRWIHALTPERSESQMQDVLRNAKKTLQRYFIGILIQVLLMSGIISIGLMIFDVKSALLIGFMAGIINIIPYIGPLIGGTIGLLIGVSSHLELDFYSEILPLAIKIVSVFSFAQLLDNFVFQPVIFSNSIKSHPLEIFLVVLIAGTVAGITGMVLAIPFYSLFRIIGAEFFGRFKIVKYLTRQIQQNRAEASKEV
jgi:predicted PurR-regulated permease PerM